MEQGRERGRWGRPDERRPVRPASPRYEPEEYAQEELPDDSPITAQAVLEEVVRFGRRMLEHGRAPDMNLRALEVMVSAARELRLLQDDYECLGPGARDE